MRTSSACFVCLVAASGGLWQPQHQAHTALIRRTLFCTASIPVLNNVCRETYQVSLGACETHPKRMFVSIFVGLIHHVI